MATHSSILTGKFFGQRSLAGYRPWGCKELDTTEWLSTNSVCLLYLKKHLGRALVIISKVKRTNHNRQMLCVCLNTPPHPILGGERNGNPLQYSCLENPMDRGAWGVIVHGSTKSWTRLSDWLTYTERIWRDSTVVSIYILLMTKEVIYCLVLYLPLTSLFVNRSFAYLKN